MTRRTLNALFVVIVFLVGLFIGHIGHPPLKAGSWPAHSDSMPEPVEKVLICSMLAQAKGSSCGFTDEFAVVVLDRFGTLTQDQLNLTVLACENALFEKAIENARKKTARRGETGPVRSKK